MAASNVGAEAPAEDAAGLNEDLLHDHVSIFPVPPLEYFQTYFSDEALERRHRSAGTTDEGDDLDSEEIPQTPSGSHVKLLKRFPSPPSLPDGSFDSFGIPITDTDHILRDLEAQGIPHLGADAKNPRMLLKRLLWSSLGKFLDLLDILIKDPSSDKRPAVSEELQNILINFHHAVNKYRLPQAMQGLVELMRFQKLRNTRQTEILLDNLSEAVRSLQSKNGEAESLADHDVKEEVDQKPVINGQKNGGPTKWPLNGLTPELERLLTEVDLLRGNI